MQTQPHSASHSTMHESDTQTRQHGIYSARQDQNCSDSHARSPTAEPRYDDVEDLSPRASKYFSDLFTLYTAQESGYSASMGNHHTVLPTTEARTASVVTLFPRFVASEPVLNDNDIAQSICPEEMSTAAQKQSFFKKRYQRMKEIHKNGPPGEARMFWTEMNSYFKERKAAVAFEMCSPRQKDEAKPEPSSESAGQQQDTSQSLHQTPWTHGTINGAKPQARKDSAVSYGNISCTSREVPVKIRRTVLEMDTNKPLPPSPPLNATPKQRLQNGEGKAMDINKPLPRTPLDCSSGTKKHSREPVEESPVDAPWPSTHTQTVGFKPPVHQPAVSQEDTRNRSQRAEQEAQRTWLNDFSDTSKAHLPPTGKSKPSKAEKAHDALKAKISRPIPIPRTVNNYPPHLEPHPGAMSEKAKGKQKTPSSPTWLNKLAHPTMPTMPTIYKPKKRPDSDESFACQGLGEGNVYAQIIMGDGALSVSDGRPVMNAGKTSDEKLIPEPLFAGRSSDGSS